LRGSAICLQNIQQFNYLIFYARLIFPLRDVQLIVDVKMINVLTALKVEFHSVIPLQFFNPLVKH